MIPAPAVLACGHVTLDRTGEARMPGGSAWYAGLAWRALGARVRVLTAAGPDFPAAALAGLEARVLAAPRTTAFENRYAPDGGRSQRVEAAAPPLDPAALPAAWRAADVLHLAPVLGEVDVRAFTAAVRARVVGLGVQGLVRAVLPGGEVAQPRWDPEPAALAGVDVAFAGEDDLRGQGDLVRRLAAAVRIVVLTRGVRGCEVISGGRTRRVGVSPAHEVDPTGAGDAFAAGFLFALARGDDPAEAARLGAAAGAIAVEARGGGALARIGEAHARARAVPVLDP